MNSLSNAMELPHELADLGVAKAIVKVRLEGRA
jgi:hypothetical protein